MESGRYWQNRDVEKGQDGDESQQTWMDVGVSPPPVSLV